MSEKMRDYQWQQAGWIASWMKRHAINLDAEPFAELQDHLAALRTHENGGQESGSVQDAVDKFRALLADCTESERQQARAIFCEVLGVGGQESEAGAVVAVVMGTESNRYIGVPDLENWSRVPFGTKLYPAAQSAQAIETAAIMKCAKVVDGWASTASEYGFDGDMEQFMRVKTDILALIPQDGRTALEELGMKVAQEVFNECQKPGRPWEKLRAIVTNLIGVPPLSSETVSGEGE